MSVIVNISQGTFSNLPSPIWGDTFSTDTRAKFRRNLGGKMLGVKVSAWPITDTFRLTVDGLSAADITAMIGFFVATRGKIINFNDYANGKWVGTVIDDPITEQVGRGCQYRLSFTLDGTFTP